MRPSVGLGGGSGLLLRGLPEHVLERSKDRLSLLARHVLDWAEDVGGGNGLLAFFTRFETRSSRVITHPTDGFVCFHMLGFPASIIICTFLQRGSEPGDLGLVSITLPTSYTQRVVPHFRECVGTLGHEFEPGDLGLEITAVPITRLAILAPVVVVRLGAFLTGRVHGFSSPFGAGFSTTGGAGTIKTGFFRISHVEHGELIRLS
jgi:hypothetical protein